MTLVTLVTLFDKAQRLAAMLFVWLLVFFLAPLGASAQSALESFDSGWLSIQSLPRHQEIASRLAREAETLVPRLEAELGVSFVRPFRMVLLPPDAGSIEELRRLDTAAPPWAAGFVLGGQDLGAVRLGSVRAFPTGDSSAVFAHELVHALLDQGQARLPRWFEEGLATHVQHRWNLSDRLRTSLDLLGARPPRLSELDGGFYRSPKDARISYAESTAFVDWAVRRHGADLPKRLVSAAAQGEIPRAFAGIWYEVTGESLLAAEAAWMPQRTWFRRLLFVFQGQGGWLLITALFIFAAIWRRWQVRRRIEAMDGPPEFDLELPVEPEPSRPDPDRWVH